jgi:hypothetical protein
VVHFYRSEIVVFCLPERAICNNFAVFELSRGVGSGGVGFSMDEC